MKNGILVLTLNPYSLFTFLSLQLTEAPQFKPNWRQVYHPLHVFKIIG
jgi:hypothetical protein